MEKFNLNIPVMRHFDDIDDLLMYGRDNEIIPGQEKLAFQFAKEIYDEVKKEDKGAVMFICSSRIRATQTAGLIIEELRKMDETLKIRKVAEPALANIDQGKFILPPDYKQGDYYAGLDIANKIFAKEVFSPDGDYLYKFGDPILQADNTYKYPELIPYFESYGENYRDFLLRIYEMILETSGKVEKLESKTKAVVVTHAQLYQILKDISAVAKMIKNDGIEVRTGDLPKLCWEQYQKRFKEQVKPAYGLNHVSIEDLYDHKIIELLKKEIEYLKTLK